jgi:chromosome segregation protein
LRLTQQAEQTGSRRGQIESEVAEIDAQLDELQERRATGEARFEELDLQLADTQEAHADLEEAVMEPPSAVLSRGPRAAIAGLERQAQEAQFRPARWLPAVASCNAASKPLQQIAGQRRVCRAAWRRRAGPSSTMPPRRPACRRCAGLEAGARRPAGQRRSRYDDLSAQLRRADEQR